MTAWDEDSARTATARLLGDSAAMRQVRDAMRQVLEREALWRGRLPPPLLLQGEAGTGKRSVAHALHLDSPRHRAPFRVLRCAGLTPGPFEAACRVQALGAEADLVFDEQAEVGLLAHGSTLVFDEVADLSPTLQARLVERLRDWAAADAAGAPAVRVIATTRRSLASLVQAGHFRADLCVGLGVVRIGLPPLRQRLDDIQLLAEHFVVQLAPRHAGHRPALARSAWRWLLANDWPGNVGDLRWLIDAALGMSAAPMLTGALFERVAGRSMPPGGLFDLAALADRSTDCSTGNSTGTSTGSSTGSSTGRVPVSAAAPTPRAPLRASA